MNYEDVKKELAQRFFEGLMSSKEIVRELARIEKEEKQALKLARKNEVDAKIRIAERLEEMATHDAVVNSIVQARGKVFVDFVWSEGRIVCKAHFPVIK